jgi:putative membrane protein
VIVKERFAPKRVIPYVRADLTTAAVASAAAYLVVDVGEVTWFTLPAAVATVLGVALSILLAFRANAAYQRWWEGAGIFAQIGAGSRTFARTVVALASAKRAAGVDPAFVDAWEREAVLRQVAWVHAVRIEARREDGWAELGRYLPPSERSLLEAADAKPVVLQALQSKSILAAYGNGVLAGLDNFQLEQALAGLAQQHALAERLKEIPIPRQYTVFARFFALLYTTVFPFAVIGTIPAHGWLVIPATLLVALVFGLIERTAWVNETPFENHVTDVPLNALTIRVERDLLELLGEGSRPEPVRPVDGYVW